MLEMKRQDLEELYQLAGLYGKTYGSKAAGELLKEVARRYNSTYKEDIQGKRNPRNAGRRRRYTEDVKNEIKSLRGKGLSIRKIAGETGCSVGYVQGVLSEPCQPVVQ